MGPFQLLAARFPVTRPWEDFDERYVTRPNPIGDEVADSLLFEPSGSHVIVGSIGSGKSTELYRAATRLQRAGSSLVVACADADLLGDGLTDPRPGILITRVAQALAATPISPPFALAGEQAAARVRRRAAAEGMPPSADVEPMETSDPDDLRQMVAALAPRRVVVLLDSFDRLLPASTYFEAIERDLLMLKRVGVGVVLTAPVDVLFLHWREALSNFSSVHVLRALDPGVGEHGEFLHAVLARRDPEELIPMPVRDALVEASGGHPRHLVQLAHAAARAAAPAGTRRVWSEDVRRACDRLGEFLADALVGEQVVILDAIVREEMPDRASDSLIGLVRDGRVFDDGDGRYRIHPALLARPARRVA